MRRRTCDRLVMPMTKQMASRMLDLPVPLKPVMALNCGSNVPITVRCAYDLKPSTTISCAAGERPLQITPFASRKVARRQHSEMQ